MRVLYVEGRKREGAGEKRGAILVQALSWKLQPHYKWRHPEHMDCQTNGVRRAQHETTPWLCDTVLSQPTPSPHPRLHTSSIFFTRLNINGKISFREWVRGGRG